ncbi:DUF364 domain-containing protein [Pulveribacter suum]|uniref:Fis family transcriptional regulator n=1 Tax=Pulveribacter suum TaxID=2116657 RepID=A0A2P1NKM6_9BURK|nr:DUF364 domain-containing protein [Pulveribacter suum]AVP57572.1 Fis family transcriptional regulator [Pulveribacter suum]
MLTTAVPAPVPPARPGRIAQGRAATAGALLAELHADVEQHLGDTLARRRLARAVLGVFFTGVQLDNGVGGLAATPIQDIPAAVCCPSSALAMPTPGRLAGRPVAEVLQDLQHTQPLRRALAIATLNALAETLWRQGGAPAGARVVEGDGFDALAIAPGEQVVVVGAFGPYLRALRQRGQPYHVVERDPATLRLQELPHFVPAGRVAEVLPQADVLLTTATTLTNGTLEGLLALLRPGARAAVVGPTATLRLAPFARRGATVVGGTRVLDARAMLDLLAEGASGYHLFGRSVQRVCLCS